MKWKERAVNRMLWGMIKRRANTLPLSFFGARFLANTLGQVMFDANLDYRYNFSAVLVWLVIILIISTLASILPARNATQISVRQSLAYG